MERLLYRVPEDAELLGVSKAKVYELVASGALPSVRLDGCRRVRADDLRQYVDSLSSVPDTVSQSFGRALRAVDVARGAVRLPLLPHSRFHDLRHIHATTLLMAGVPVHVVADRLGHADPSITLRVYAHVLHEHASGAADVFAHAVSKTGLGAVEEPEEDAL